MSKMPALDCPLYNHPLPKIEQWLRELGCKQNPADLHRWTVLRPNWTAEICLDTEALAVSYLKAGADGTDIERAFKYSLSRQDVEDAVFSGP